MAARALLVVVLSCAGALRAPAQGLRAPPDSLLPTARADTAARAEERARPRWRFIHLNEVETPVTTFRVGGGVLVDYASYAQDEGSNEQLQIEPDVGFRDTRIVFGGKMNSKRSVTWSAGVMYDTNNEKWFVRQTGVDVAVPEISGHLWIGRSKEGVSLNRVMVGYDGWTMERFPFSDAAIPLLADGVKWMGYSAGAKLVWNLGVFTDWLSEGQTFSYFRSQVAGRIAHVRFDSETAGNLLHVGIGGHVGLPTEDSLRLKSKPEATFGPTFVDTGTFGSELAGLLGVEAYYRAGSWLFGGEYHGELADFNGNAETSDEPDASDPVDDLRRDALHLSRSVRPTGAPADDLGSVFFHGGDVVATWNITGETRPYTTQSGSFRSISPRRPVYDRGPGAWEAVLRFSYTDLDTSPLAGGKFWRLTPMLNWYLSDQIRLEAAYGYSGLDRFGTTGYTHFFQTRIQTQL